MVLEQPPRDLVREGIEFFRKVSLMPPRDIYSRLEKMGYRGQEAARGRNRAERSQEITTGSYKKQETYGRQAADSQIRILLASLFDRIGAFSLHAGLASIVWCATAWRNRKAMSALLLTYLVTGLAFFSSDLRYFAGTTYFVVKQVLGAFWMFAIILHFWPLRLNRSPQ